MNEIGWGEGRGKKTGRRVTGSSGVILIGHVGRVVRLFFVREFSILLPHVEVSFVSHKLQ
jgi:hypothetical protein